VSKELKELREAVSIYALEHSINEIPQHYYEKIVKIWQDRNLNGHDWDQYKAAAALLYVYAAAVDGIVHQSQMTPQGYRAMNWASRSQLNLDAGTASS
jgi:hypothetical protein